MKHVLMLIPFFPPMAGGGVHRPLSFVRCLRDHGWEPTVVAPRGDAFWIRDDALEKRIPDGIEVIRTDTLSGQSVLARVRGGAPAAQSRSTRGFGMLRRLASAFVIPDTYAGWYPYAVRAAREACRRRGFDALFTTSPPETSHVVGRTIHRETDLPWVADFRDPWMNLYLLPPPSPLHRRLHRRLERDVCRKATIVVTTRWHEQLLRESYPGADVRRISNGFDGDAIRNVHGHVSPDGPMQIIHAGMLTQKRNAHAFLRALKQFEEARSGGPGVRVTFVGAREDANDRAVASLGLSNIVRFEDSVPHAESLRRQKSSHILLLIKHTDPAYQGLVPGKMYEYIGLERPILGLVPDGEARDTIVSLERGEVAGPDDIRAINEAINRMYEHYCNGTLDQGYRLEARPEFDRAALAGQMASVLDDAVARRRS